MSQLACTVMTGSIKPLQISVHRPGVNKGNRASDPFAFEFRPVFSVPFAGHSVARLEVKFDRTKGLAPAGQPRVRVRIVCTS